MTQPITPELKRWIIEQAGAGQSRKALYDSMVKAGWQATSASKALVVVLGADPALGAVEPELPPPPANAVPEPDLSGEPAMLMAHDREVKILAHMKNPRIVVFGGLLSSDECGQVMASARERLKRSETIDVKTGGSEINNVRTSDGMFFERKETELIDTIEKRIAALVNWPIENGEGMQILRYGPGAQYEPHYDYFDPTQPGTPTIVKRGGQRVGTLIMYLQTPLRGGGTTFPDVPFECAPQAGNAVFFSYDRPDAATRTLHGGAPVLEGEKWIATKWLREGVFV